MSQISSPPLMKPFMAVFSQDSSLMVEAIERLTVEFAWPDSSLVDILSSEISIAETTYYANEMGENLNKRYLTWESLISPELLVKLKLKAMEIEKYYAKNDKRCVNLDPGYIFAGGLVLSTAKFTGHRLYLGEGVWGELTLHYHRGDFSPFNWTYPDYLKKEVLEILQLMRKKYMLQIKNVEARNK